MARKLVCKDIGFDCGWEATAETDEELMPKIAEHAKMVHGLDPVPPDVMGRVQAALKTV